MSAWTAKRITADAAQKMQVNSGLLLNNFDVANPTAPADADIVCETTGNFKISCKPETVDWFDNVNNAPKNTKEGKDITGWLSSLSVTALSITEETLGFAMGAFKKTGDKLGITPRSHYTVDDFKKLYWVGDMMDGDSALVVVMDDTVSTGGLDFTSNDGGKGELALELMPHASMEKPGEVPMAFYIVTKVGDGK